MFFFGRCCSTRTEKTKSKVASSNGNATLALVTNSHCGRSALNFLARSTIFPETSIPTHEGKNWENDLVILPTPQPKSSIFPREMLTPFASHIPNTRFASRSPSRKNSSVLHLPNFFSGSESMAHSGSSSAMAFQLDTCESSASGFISELSENLVVSLLQTGARRPGLSANSPQSATWRRPPARAERSRCFPLARCTAGRTCRMPRNASLMDEVMQAYSAALAQFTTGTRQNNIDDFYSDF